MDHPYCQVVATEVLKLPSQSKLHAKFQWLIVGSNSQEASDREKLAWHFCNLPGWHFVEETQDITPWQWDRWCEMKITAIRFARCFLAGTGTEPEDPLLWEVEAGYLTQREHDFYWLEVNRFLNLWEMVSLKWDLFRPYFETSSPLKIFKRIATNQVDGAYERVLRPYFKSSNYDRRRLMTLGHLNTQNRLDGEGLKEFKRLTDEYQVPSQTLLKVLNTGGSLAKDDKFVFAKMRVNDALMAAIFLLGKDVTRTTGGSLFATETWKDGIRY